MNKSIITQSAVALLCLCAASCGKTGEVADDNSASGVGQNLPVYNIAQSDTSTINKSRKNVLVLSASPRKGGNTDLLCDEFVRGAQEAGGNVEKVFLDDYKIDFFHEQHEHSADSVASDDQAPLIINKMVNADIIVLSSPVYYMNIDGQLKTLMDRCFRNKGLPAKNSTILRHVLMPRIPLRRPRYSRSEALLYVCQILLKEEWLKPSVWEEREP